MAQEYQVCTRCIMDTTDPAITFDEHGVCSFCKRDDEMRALSGYRPGVSEQELEKTLAIIKENSRDREYDCIVGVSGGVDSAYMLYQAIERGLRVLAVHVDSGWNLKLAEDNIRKMCDALKVKLHTYEMDWPTMRELQRAYMFSGVANIDVVQDHLYCAAIYEMARKYNVKYILNGSNIATEGASAPFSAQHTYRDSWHMKSIYKKHGRGMKLDKYPFLSFRDAWLGLPGVTKINLLDYLPYSKTEAIRVLNEKFGWQYYGGKHFECRFTRYFQSVYLPVKFQYDKRRSHLSCLIRNGEMTREEALEEIAQPPYPLQEQQADEEHILSRLEIEPEQWQRILHQPPTPNSAYFSQQKLFDTVKTILGRERLDRIRNRIYSVK